MSTPPSRIPVTTRITVLVGNLNPSLYFWLLLGGVGGVDPRFPVWNNLNNYQLSSQLHIPPLLNISTILCHSNSNLVFFSIQGRWIFGIGHLPWVHVVLLGPLFLLAHTGHDLEPWSETGKKWRLPRKKIPWNLTTAGGTPY